MHLEGLLRKSNDTSFYYQKQAEQSLLTNYFAGEWLSLPLRYNLAVGYTSRADVYERVRPDARVLHFGGRGKPWYTCKEEGLVQRICPKPGASVSSDVLEWRSIFRQVSARHGFTFDALYGENPEEGVRLSSLAEMIA